MCTRYNLHVKEINKSKENIYIYICTYMYCTYEFDDKFEASSSIWKRWPPSSRGQLSQFRPTCKSARGEILPSHARTCTRGLAFLIRPSPYYYYTLFRGTILNRRLHSRRSSLLFRNFLFSFSPVDDY